MATQNTPALPMFSLGFNAPVQDYLSLSGHTAPKILRGSAVTPTFVDGGLYNITRGFALVTHPVEGFAGYPMVYGPDEFFGCEYLFGDRPSRMAIRPLGSVEFICWDRKALETQLAVRPLLALGLAQECDRLNRRLITRLHHFHTMTCAQRLYEVLMDFVTRYGIPHADGTLIPFHITHEALAGMIGTGRERVSVFIKAFRDQDLVKTIGRQPMIIRPSFWTTHITDNYPRVH